MLALLAALPLAAPTAGDLLVVDAANGPGTDYTAIQPAVDAALPGDLLRVLPGTYAAFVLDGKGLSIVGDLDAGAVHVVDGPAVEVRNVPPGQTALLQGLVLDTHEGTRFTDNFGPVILSDSTSIARPESVFFPQFDSGPGLEIRDCAEVWLEEVDVVGAEGYASILDTPASLGLNVISSVAFVYDATITGGDGQDSCIGKIGADALRGASSALTFRNVTLHGGAAGECATNPDANGIPGIGGALVDTTLFAYASQLDEVLLIGDALLSETQTPPVGLEVDALIATGPNYDVELSPPGASFGFLLVAANTQSAPIPIANGATAVGFTPIFLNLGFFSDASSTTFALPSPNVTPGTAVPLVFQSVFAELDGSLHLSNPAWLHLL